ncbi:MAG: ABC transporter permease [Herbinix sp.]|nr:ABC transporter permease [Herbinix sp.]
MIGLEIKKIRHTFLQPLILLSLIGPLLMITVINAIDSDKTFLEVVVSNSVFVQMIPFAVTVIFGCFIVAREYKENMMVYLKIMPHSQVKIMFSKIIVIVLELWLTQIITFIMLFLINTVIEGYDIDILLKYIGAGLISATTFSCLVPLIVFISLLRRNFSGSALILLIIFMMTFPFIFSENGYIFPHLLPMILVAKSFGSSVYNKISFLGGTLILIGIATIFYCLSIRIAKKKE